MGAAHRHDGAIKIHSLGLAQKIDGAGWRYGHIGVAAGTLIERAGDAVVFAQLEREITAVAGALIAAGLRGALSGFEMSKTALASS